MSRVICQFSCGAASAVATKMALAQNKNSEVVIVNAFIKEEDDDNRRFLADSERWFGRRVLQLRDEKYGASADEVWRRKQYRWRGLLESRPQSASAGIPAPR